MKRTTWTLTLILLLATTSASFADSPFGGRDRYRHSDRFPRPDQMERVARLAHGVDELAEDLHEQAERNNRRPNRFFAQVLGDLHDLSNAASRFHNEVESYQRDPRHTRDDFQRLLSAYYALDESLQDIDPRSYIDRGVERIGQLLSQLDDYYGLDDRYSSGRRGRYDRDGGHGWGGWRRERYPASFELRNGAGDGPLRGEVRIRL